MDESERRDIPREQFARDVEWPPPSREPGHEPVDGHHGPLDDEADAFFLESDDPRRLEVERRLERERREGYGPRWP